MLIVAMFDVPELVVEVVTVIVQSFLFFHPTHKNFLVLPNAANTHT
jgi:hypothetical protein